MFIYLHVIAFEGKSQVEMYIGNLSEYETLLVEKFGKYLQTYQVKYRTLKR